MVESQSQQITSGRWWCIEYLFPLPSIVIIILIIIIITIMIT